MKEVEPVWGLNDADGHREAERQGQLSFHWLIKMTIWEPEGDQIWPKGKRCSEEVRENQRTEWGQNGEEFLPGRVGVPA